MAFGNSITEGKAASGALTKSYAERLRDLLASRYVSQSMEVVNAGCGGELTTGGTPPCTGGVVRLPAVLNTVHPQVLLLEEGTNDLSRGDPTKITPMINALRDMVREAKSRGIPVFLGTLLPEREGGRNAGALPLLVEANGRIRQLAQAEGATLVDLYDGFGGGPDPYIDVDGLHPTEEGYQRMAQLFFDAIRATLETAAAVGPVFTRNMPVPIVPGGGFR